MDFQVRFKNRDHASRPDVKWETVAAARAAKRSMNDSFLSGAAERPELVEPHRSLEMDGSSIFTNVMMVHGI